MSSFLSIGMWVGTSIQTNLRDSSRPGLRVTIFAVALAAVFMAPALPEASGDQGLLFACAYWAGRLVLGSSLLRRSAQGAAARLNPCTISIFVTGPLLVVGALLPSGAREALWAFTTAYLPALAALTVLAATVSILNLFEFMRVEQIGWRARLAGTIGA